MGAGWGLAADIRDAGGEVASIDATDRQLHHPGSSARRWWKKGGPDHAIGRSRGGLSTKIHAVVDQDGLPVRIILTAGQASDMTAVPELLAGLPVPITVVADRGYDSNAVLDLIRRSGAEPSIPSTSQRSVRRSVDMAIYRQRNLVERFFCKLKQLRRIATRFDKLARNFLAAVLIASTRLWLRAL
jgi:transposase